MRGVNKDIHSGNSTCVVPINVFPAEHGSMQCFGSQTYFCGCSLNTSNCLYFMFYLKVAKKEGRWFDARSHLVVFISTFYFYPTTKFLMPKCQNRTSAVLCVII